jgi:hypothetical protein
MCICMAENLLFKRASLHYAVQTHAALRRWKAALNVCKQTKIGVGSGCEAAPAWRDAGAKPHAEPGRAARHSAPLYRLRRSSFGFCQRV